MALRYRRTTRVFRALVGLAAPSWSLDDDKRLGRVKKCGNVIIAHGYKSSLVP
jgi:hypothetical protein